MIISHVTLSSGPTWRFSSSFWTAPIYIHRRGCVRFDLLSSSTSRWGLTFSSYVKHISRCVLILPSRPPSSGGGEKLAARGSGAIRASRSAAGGPAARSVLPFLVYAHLAWVPGVDTSRCDVTPAPQTNAELRGKTLRWRQEGRGERKKKKRKKKIYWVSLEA